MYDLFEFKPNTKETAVACIAVLIFMVFVFCAGYWVGLRNAGTGVPDNGNGVKPVGEQLSTAIQHQHEITAGLNSAVEGSGAAAATADHIAVTAGEAAAAVGDAGILIDQCQQIIGRVRNRGKK